MMDIRYAARCNYLFFGFHNNIGVKRLSIPFFVFSVDFEAMFSDVHPNRILIWATWLIRVERSSRSGAWNLKSPTVTMQSWQPGRRSSDHGSRNDGLGYQKSSKKACSVVGGDKTLSRQTPRSDADRQLGSVRATSDGSASPILSISRPGRIQCLGSLSKVQIEPSNKLANEIDGPNHFTKPIEVVEDTCGLLERDPSRTQCGPVCPSKEKKLGRQPRKN
ncbi:hypothetical protein Ancab_000640 [Ancistrocladus abbreviatus]